MITEIILQLRALIEKIRESGSNVPRWMRYAALLALILTFLRTLLPPFEAYDALLYHLTIPELWLREGGLRAYDFPHYWFPGLVEGMYLWGLGLGSEIVPQQIHFLFTLLTSLIVWHWARSLWDDLTAWWTVTILVSMPSLLLLAGWAYTDMALACFGVLMLFTLWLGIERNNTSWWKLGAIAAGMAMGVKYTSLVIPLTALILIATWTVGNWSKRSSELIRFGLIAGSAGFIWYLRNWYWMGNPFYPFVFGGRHWDPFRAAAFSGAGSGSGWDLKAILSLPLTITLGYQDINYFDGNIGPLFLLTLPLAFWQLARGNHLEPRLRKSLASIGLFTTLSASFWTYGYVTTRSLWQARLLFPALIPFTIPAAVGLVALSGIIVKGIRVYFIVSSLAALSVFVILLDFSLGVIARNPLAVASGIVSRESYLEKYQPGYLSVMQMVSQTPLNSKIYSLFEPRSYQIPRSIQPDAILDNFPYDVYLQKNPDDIVNTWRAEGFTHVLLNIRGANLALDNKTDGRVLDQTISLLKPFSTSPDGDYALYEIPPR